MRRQGAGAAILGVAEGMRTASRRAESLGGRLDWPATESPRLPTMIFELGCARPRRHNGPKPDAIHLESVDMMSSAATTQQASPELCPLVVDLALGYGF